MSRRLTVLATVLAAAVPLAVLGIGVLLIGGGSAANGADQGVGSGHYTPILPHALTAPPRLSPVPQFDAGTSGLPGGAGALVARLLKPTVLRSSPGGGSIGSLGLKTVFGSPVVMWVERYRPGWLGVVNPVTGNGLLGWIRRSDVSLGRVRYEIKVSLSQRHVTVLYKGQQIERYLIAVGKPSAPTPTGNFAVTDRLKTGDPSGPYGCCILALSALAPHAIQDWSGGNRIAIHSTPETSSIGLPVSHGCMRLTLPEGQWLITHVPLGTPVIIRE